MLPYRVFGKLVRERNVSVSAETYAASSAFTSFSIVGSKWDASSAKWIEAQSAMARHVANAGGHDTTGRGGSFTGSVFWTKC